MKPPSTHPLTAEEAQSEFDYRLQERLNMMAPEGNPTEEQRAYANWEVTREVRLLRMAMANPADR